MLHWGKDGGMEQTDTHKINHDYRKQKLNLNIFGDLKILPWMRFFRFQK